LNIKGKSRAGGRELAKHLENAEKNETVKVLSVNGTVAHDLRGAFQEMEATASGTQCEKPLYHVKISPDPKEPALTPEQWNRAIAAVREEFGVTDHAYAVVLHTKYGAAHPDILREHAHVVISRINPDTMLAMHDGHNYRKHELVARDLEQEFGHARIQGAHVDRDGVDRPQRTPPDWAMQQAVKSGIQPRDVADTVKQLWKEADSPKSFAAALQLEGLTLALGRRDLVILDGAGDVHTLARCLNLKVAEIRERMAGIDRSKLPTVEEARGAIRERKEEKEKTAPVSEVSALAALLQTPIDRKGHRDLSAKEIEAQKETMAAFGFDSAKPATLAKWQELGDRVDAGRITEKERTREMGLYLWHEADKERRAGHDPNEKQPKKHGGRERPPQLDRDR